jgi:hypothetical protein
MTTFEMVPASVVKSIPLTQSLRTPFEIVTFGGAASSTHDEFAPLPSRRRPPRSSVTPDEVILTIGDAMQSITDLLGVYFPGAKSTIPGLDDELQSMSKPKLPACATRPVTRMAVATARTRPACAALRIEHFLLRMLFLLLSPD